MKDYRTPWQGMIMDIEYAQDIDDDGAPIFGAVDILEILESAKREMKRLDKAEEKT